MSEPTTFRRRTVEEVRAFYEGMRGGVELAHNMISNGQTWEDIAAMFLVMREVGINVATEGKGDGD